MAGLWKAKPGTAANLCSFEMKIDDEWKTLDYAGVDDKTFQWSGTIYKRNS